MHRVLSTLIVAAAFAGTAFAQGSDSKPAAKNSPLLYTMESIDGQKVELASYKGRVILLINTASKCGLTLQYGPLQAIYSMYKDKGFEVLAFPANNFGAQEPGTDEQIREFCSVNYNVTFPLFSKVSVKGDDICPLYAYLTSEETNPGFAGEIPWNFTKFLVDRRGKVVARFEPRTTPDDEKVTAAIEKELAAK
ncbi:MAG: glutathione peroxidase [Candidatus Glassbacteria bacterium]|nr:glutathione peroxidase [Candidatus Glassbacteria bacterium]